MQPPGVRTMRLLISDRFPLHEGVQVRQRFPSLGEVPLVVPVRRRRGAPRWPRGGEPGRRGLAGRPDCGQLDIRFEVRSGREPAAVTGAGRDTVLRCG